MPFVVRIVLGILISVIGGVLFTATPASAKGETYFWADDGHTKVTAIGGEYAKSSNNLSGDFKFKGTETGQTGILELRNTDSTAAAAAETGKCTASILIDGTQNKMASATVLSCTDSSGYFDGNKADAIELSQDLTISSNFCYTKYSSDTTRAACAAGEANKTDYTYCIDGDNFSGDLNAQRNACFIGQGQSVDGDGKTSGQLCAGIYNLSMITSAQVTHEEVAACIFGAENRDDSAICDRTWDGAEAFYAQRVAACKEGQKQSVAESEDGAETNPYTSDGSTSDDVPSCGGLVEGIGWIVCPLLDGLAGLNDMMWGLILSNLLNVNPLEQNGSIYQLWGTLRSIANVLLIIAFLFIVFSQLTNAGVSNYGVKKMLPRLIIAAIAINISYFIVAVLVDVFNITGSSIYDILKGIADQSKDVPTWDNLIGIVVGLGAGVGIGIVGVSAAGGVGAALLLLLPAAAMAVLAFIVALVVLMLRQALIPLLAVLAPIAIVMYLFPNTETWFTKWRKTLLSMLLLYPIAAFLFGGLQVIAVTIAGDNANWFSTLTALIVMAAPLFMLPFIARQAGPMLGKIGGALGNLSERARKPIQDWAGSHAGLRRAKYLGAPMRNDKNGNPILRDRMRAAAQARYGKRREREIKTAAWNAESDAAIARKVGAKADALAAEFPVNGAGAAYIRAVETRAQGEELKAALEPLVKEIAAVRAGSHPSFAGTDVDAFLLARATSTTHSAAEREVAMHQAAALGRDGVIRGLDNHPALAGYTPEERQQHAEARQRAIAANAGALVGKAPDIVKGADAAFGSVTGADLAGYSAGTAAAQVAHLQELHAQANDMTRSVAQRAASQADLDTAVASFDSAIEDIRRDPSLQAKFSGDTGRRIESTIAASNPAFQTYITAHLTKRTHIQADGKIRP